MRQGCPYAEKLPENVRPERLHELFFRYILNLVARVLLGSVTDKTVELAELGDNAFGGLLTE